MDSSQPLMVGLQRPLLVLLDRNMDLATPLHHTWTYQALSHDVLVSAHVLILDSRSLQVDRWLVSCISYEALYFPGGPVFPRRSCIF